MSRDPHDYTIEACQVCGAQLDREHGATRAWRCAVPGHASHGAMIVRVVARPDAQQDGLSYRGGRIPANAQLPLP